MEILKKVSILIFLIVTFASEGYSQDSNRFSSEFSARFDCLLNGNSSEGANQNCLTVTALKLDIKNDIDEKLFAEISLNPFKTTSYNHQKRPDRDSLPYLVKDRTGIIEDYSISWIAKDNLRLILGSYYGSTMLPDTSGLSFSSQYDENGWRQTALTIRYILPFGEETMVEFTGGNGEGENTANLDPQQYFGFRLKASPLKGFNGYFGLSFDGNNAGSDTYDWQLEELKRCNISVSDEKITTGYSTRRIAVGAELDGFWENARGLKVGMGYYKSIKNDLNKNATSFPSIKELAGCENLALNYIFIEDPDNQRSNEVIQNVIAFNASYRIMDTYFLGFDYEDREVDFGVVDFFEPCESFIGKSCQNRLPNTNKIKQTSISLGVGVDLHRKLTMILEYNMEYFDQLYSKFNYQYQDEKLSESREIFNMRLAYNWK